MYDLITWRLSPEHHGSGWIRYGPVDAGLYRVQEVLSDDDDGQPRQLMTWLENDDEIDRGLADAVADALRTMDGTPSLFADYPPHQTKTGKITGREHIYRLLIQAGAGGKRLGCDMVQAALAPPGVPVERPVRLPAMEASEFRSIYADLLAAGMSRGEIMAALGMTEKDRRKFARMHKGPEHPNHVIVREREAAVLRRLHSERAGRDPQAVQRRLIQELARS